MVYIDLFPHVYVSLHIYAQTYVLYGRSTNVAYKVYVGQMLVLYKKKVGICFYVSEELEYTGIYWNLYFKSCLFSILKYSKSCLYMVLLYGFL